jgi:hypothetical protein
MCFISIGAADMIRKIFVNNGGFLNHQPTFFRHLINFPGCIIKEACAVSAKDLSVQNFF